MQWVHLSPSICDINNFGIFDDPRKKYFIDVETLYDRYTFHIGLLRSYGHNFKVQTIDEFVKLDVVVIRDGLIARSDGALYYICQYNRYDFDEEIFNSINLEHWLQIKNVIKLCNNKDAP